MSDDHGELRDQYLTSIAEKMDLPPEVVELVKDTDASTMYDLLEVQRRELAEFAAAFISEWAARDLAEALADRDRARDVAVALEQELAELRARVDAVVVSAVAFRGWDDSHTVWELDDVAMLALVASDHGFHGFHDD